MAHLTYGKRCPAALFSLRANYAHCHIYSKKVGIHCHICSKKGFYCQICSNKVGIIVIFTVKKLYSLSYLRQRNCIHRHICNKKVVSLSYLRQKWLLAVLKTAAKKTVEERKYRPVIPSCNGKSRIRVQEKSRPISPPVIISRCA